MKALSMQRQHDWILPALALISIVMGGILFRIDQRLPGPAWEGRDLISGLDPQGLSKISFSSNGRTFSLNRQGDTFSIDTQNAAPAELNKVNEVILRLGGSQISQVVGQKSDWEKFRVSDKNAELIIELHTKGPSPTWKLYLGQPITGKAGRAVRLEGREEVFATKDFLYLSSTDTDYLSTEALRISKSKVTNLDVYLGGQKLDDKKFLKEELITLMEPLKVKSHYRTGVLPAELQDINWKWKAQVLNENGIVYHVSFANKDSKWFAKAMAGANQSLEMNTQILDVKFISLKAEVDKFNQEKMPWIWEVSSESAEKLKKALMIEGPANANKVSKK